MTTTTARERARAGLAWIIDKFGRDMRLVLMHPGDLRFAGAEILVNLTSMPFGYLDVISHCSLTPGDQVMLGFIPDEPAGIGWPELNNAWAQELASWQRSLSKPIAA